MALDYYALSRMRKSHPAWRLLRADYAPLIASFLDFAFRERNLRQIPESEMRMLLDDYLFQLKQTDESQEFAREGENYLADWSKDEQGWLRKFYPAGADEPYFDLTPSTEKALQWLEGLFNQEFVGTESRMQTIFQLLQEMVEGAERDPGIRIAQLQAEKKAINRKIRQLKDGDIEPMDSRELRERFALFRRNARDLLGDFREVEQNFRDLDRRVRERIATWKGDKSELLDEIFGRHDAITDSDQGQSFRAFWDFLMSPSSQEEISERLDRIFSLEELPESEKDVRLRRIHYDWMTAGEQTQRVVAHLSRQLRSFLDDRAFYENRRIAVLIESIEEQALSLEKIPQKRFMDLECGRPGVSLPMERPLFVPPLPIDLTDRLLSGLDESVETEALFDLDFIDREKMEARIRSLLEEREKISLGKILELFPLEKGLSELMIYLCIAAEQPYTVVDEEREETVAWITKRATRREARLPRILLCRRPEES